MKQILVVDDDRELRTTLVEVLEHNGFSVTAAEHAEAAFAQLEKRKVDLLLLDMVMPGIDGVSAIALFRQKCPRARIIIMTAYASVQNAVQTLQQGADDYLTKPFKIDDLLVSVRRCLEEARFAGSEEVLDMDNTFKCLANAIRRQILVLLTQHDELRFMDMARLLNIEDHTKVNFHLKMLRESDLLLHHEKKTYQLTKKGHRVVACMKECFNPPGS